MLKQERFGLTFRDGMGTIVSLGACEILLGDSVLHVENISFCDVTLTALGFGIIVS